MAPYIAEQRAMLAASAIANSDTLAGREMNSIDTDQSPLRPNGLSKSSEPNGYVRSSARNPLRFTRFAVTNGNARHGRCNNRNNPRDHRPAQGAFGPALALARLRLGRYARQYGHQPDLRRARRHYRLLPHLGPCLTRLPLPRAATRRRLPHHGTRAHRRPL